MAERRETATLVGGPGNGQKVTVGKDWIAFRWVPETDAEREEVERRGFTGDPNSHTFIYRRSERTRTKFVYQP